MEASGIGDVTFWC